MSPLVSIFPEAGLAFLAQAFFVVILGGAGRIAGVFGGAVVIAAAATISAAYVSPLFSQVIVLSLAVLVMRFRPQGFLPNRQREAELSVVGLEAAETRMVAAATAAESDTDTLPELPAALDLYNVSIAPPGQDETGSDARAPETPGEAHDL